MEDPSFAEQLVEDLGADALRTVVGVFEGDARRLTGVMTAAAAVNDGAAFRRAAHGLAGAAGAVGASALEHAARMAMTRTDVSGPGMVAAAAEMEHLATVAVADLVAFVANLPAE